VGIGETLISAVEAGSAFGIESPIGTVLRSPLSRRTVAQILGAAYIDCWRVMYVNREAIDQGAEALIAQGELVGDEIRGLLDSIGLRFPTDADPFPEDQPFVPVSAMASQGRIG